MLGLSLLLTAFTDAQTTSHTPQPDTSSQAFQAALADYDAGRFEDAATLLETIKGPARDSFDLHELLGLIYGAQGDSARAILHLQQAAQLKPDSPSAKTNLATALIRAGQFARAEVLCHQVLTRHPADFSANRTLAQLALRRDDPSAALPFLEAAQAAQPAAADNGYDLALALLTQKSYDESSRLIHTLQAQQDSGELHNLLGQIAEQQGRYLDAANEFETAAHMKPTEDNLFLWASDLLHHRAYEAAITVFKSATERFPSSPRLWTGLGMSYYARGAYKEAISSLLTAADLKPDDPRCYVFLSKAYLSSPSQAQEVIARFRRYAELQPRNALAQFYYALALWNGRRLETPDVDYKAVQALLERSIALDSTLAETHLQLGILLSDQQQYARSGTEFERALQLDPTLADAHFRLGRFYLHEGEKAKSQAEFQTFKKLQAEQMAQVDKNRANVQQFVIAAPAPAQP